MDFIVKDEPAGWAISVWVIDKVPTGIRLMVPDEVVHGEIVWRWDSLVEGQELPTPTFRFNWDFIEEFTCAIQKRLPKRVDDEVLKTLQKERERVDTFIGYLTRENIEKTTQIYSQMDVDYLKQQNETLQKQVQMLQAELLQKAAKADPNYKSSPMQAANQIMEEVYSPQATYTPEQTTSKSNKGAFQTALEQEMAQYPVSPPKLVVSPTAKEEFLKALMHQGQVIPVEEFSKKNLEAMGFKLPEL